MENRRNASYDQLLKDIQGNNTFNVVRLILQYSLKIIGRVAATSLPALILLLRFHDWWNASEYSKAKDTLPIPPPPHPVTLNPAGVDIPKNWNCPICKRQRINPAALNGIVYCYTCIYSQIRETNRCPVSLKSTSVDSLRKIYES